MVSLRQQEQSNLPVVDYSLKNNRVLPQLCHLPLQECGTIVVQGWQELPPQQGTLTVGLYAWVLVEGCPNVGTKIITIDFEG